jgi:hypothetical protein
MQLQAILRDLEQRNIMDVLRTKVPQVLGAIGRAPLSPFAAGQIGGSISESGTMQNVLPPGLLMGP